MQVSLRPALNLSTQARASGETVRVRPNDSWQRILLAY